MKKMLLILNPKAGQMKAGRHLAEIIGIFNRADYQVDTFVTARPGDAARVASERAGDVDTVVCIGGDGTFNETVTGVLQSGAKVDLGYLPAGTTNDFANGLRISSDMLKAAAAVVEGRAEEYDVGRFDDRYFTYVASFGAFTKASYTTPQSAKNLLGHLAYVFSGIQELSQLRTVHVCFVLDGDRKVEDDFLFGAICNATSVGGILTLDPAAVDLRDGKFELLLIRSPKDLPELADCIRALQTKKYDSKLITFQSASRIEVFCDEPMDWTLDGERATGQNAVVQNVQKAIRLIRKGQ